MSCTRLLELCELSALGSVLLVAFCFTETIEVSQSDCCDTGVLGWVKRQEVTILADA